MNSDRLRILVIAPLRFPIRRPHAGGLESTVWAEVAALRERGHAVTMIGVKGSDFVEPGSVFEMPELRWPRGASPTDKTYPASYQALSTPSLDRALQVIASHTEKFDVISNHCLHPLPLWWAPELAVPMVTTLHTPVDEQFVAAHLAAGRSGSSFLAVSEYTRSDWASVGVESEVLSNGTDPRSWPLGPGGDHLVWFGRIVPEKGPHLAVEVARLLGRRLTIAGRVGDRVYAEGAVFPLLGNGIRHVGALSPHRLAALVGRSAAAISTPAWAEPFGLVAPEALMCGTPVVSFAVGGVPEIAAGSIGMRVVAQGDVSAMADRVDGLIRRTAHDEEFRPAIRSAAVTRFSLETRIDVLEQRFRDLVAGRAPRAPRVEELSR